LHITKSAHLVIAILKKYACSTASTIRSFLFKVMKHFLFSVLMFNSVFLNGYNALLQTSQDYLQQINDLTTNAAVKNCQQQKYTVIPVAISTSEFETWREKAKLAAKLIEETQSLNHKKLVQSSLRHLLSKNSIIQEVDLKIKIISKLLYHLHSKNMD